MKINILNIKKIIITEKFNKKLLRIEKLAWEKSFNKIKKIHFKKRIFIIFTENKLQACCYIFLSQSFEAYYWEERERERGENTHTFDRYN